MRSVLHEDDVEIHPELRARLCRHINQSRPIKSLAYRCKMSERWLYKVLRNEGTGLKRAFVLRLCADAGIDATSYGVLAVPDGPGHSPEGSY